MSEMISEARAKLNIAENLRRFMDDRDLTQSQLAEKSGISQSFVSKVLRGVSLCSARDLKNIADALGVTMDELANDPLVPA